MKKSYTFWPKSQKIVAFAKNVLSKKVGLVAGLVLMFSMSAFSQKNWYLQVDSLKPGTTTQVKVAPNNLKAWTADPRGHGYDSVNSVWFAKPTSFTDSNQIFTIQSSGFTAATGTGNANPWNVTGAHSKIVIGTDTTISFTSNINTNSTIDVLNKATFFIYSPINTGIKFGNLAVGSTIRYAGATPATQQVLAGNYYNLAIVLGGANTNTGQVASPFLLPAGTIGVAGSFSTSNKYANFNSFNINFNGTGGQVIPQANYYNLTISGNKTVPDSLTGTVAVAGTFSDLSTGAPLNLFTISKGANVNSTVAYNGLLPQFPTVSNYNGLSFTNGQGFQIDSIDFYNKRVVLYNADPELQQGFKISAAGTTVELDTATYVSSVNGTSVYLTEAPTLRALWFPLGHPATNPNGKAYTPDTLHIISWTAGAGTVPAQIHFDREIDTLFTVGIQPGDTITSQVLYPKVAGKNAPIVTTVSPDNDSTVYIQSTNLAGTVNAISPLANTVNLGTLTFGLPGNLPSTKTLSGTINLLGAFNPGLGTVNTAGSTISFNGLANQTVPAIGYDNVIINESKTTFAATTATVGAPTFTGKVTVQQGSFVVTNNTTANVDVLANGTFVFEQPNSAGITFGTLAPGSTVRYGGNLAAYQSVLPNYNYSNLNLQSYNGNCWPLVLPTSPINVAGTFATSSKYTNLVGSTFNFNGTGGTLLGGGTFYNLIFSGNKTIADTLNGTFTIAGTLTNTSTGAGIAPTRYNAAGVASGSSTVSYIGLVPQTIAPLTYWNVNFSHGQPFWVKDFNYANSTVTLYSSAPELAVGDKVIVNSNPLFVDSTTTITAINDTILTLSNAPTLRVFDAHLGHVTGAAKDTFAITSFGLLDSTIVLATVPGTLLVGDTLTSTILNGNRFVRAINGNTIQLSLSPFAATYGYGSLTIGTPSKVPTPKTIVDSVFIKGAFNPNYGNYGATSINVSNSTVVFNGKKQNIPGITYNNLVINQDSAFTAALSASALVQGAFTLASGKLTTNTTNKLLTLDVNATFPPVANDTFFVNGGLAKNFASTTPFTYQIGSVNANISRARSVVVTPATVDAKTYIVNFAVGKVANATKFDSTSISVVDPASYYNVALSNYAVGVDTSAKISFQYRYDSSITNESLLLSEYDGTQFTSVGTVLQPASGPAATFGTISTDNSVSTFGHFAFAFGIPYPMPVKFGTVSASALSNGTVKVSWESLSEVNVSKYVVETSTDGSTFSDKGVVVAKGASEYSLVDLTPAVGVNYYRIKEVDNNGTATYSAVVSVKESALIASLSIYPNPVANKQLNFVLNTGAADYTLKVTNILGQSILAKAIGHNGGAASYSVALPQGIKAGTYFVKLSNGINQLTKTIVVE